MNRRIADTSVIVFLAKLDRLELERLRGMGFWVTEALAAQALRKVGEA